ncbi:MAG: ABC transporter permease, partial [Crenarchaeota archaeon]|nr:ABC transporter permease [Thermoproteota archaeon]
MSERRKLIIQILKNKNVIAGLVFLSIILYMCALAFTQYSWVFTQWSNQTYWETYYPINAPPAWIAFFTGKTYAPYMIVNVRGNGTSVCEFDYYYHYDVPPQDIEFIVHKPQTFAKTVLYVILPNGKKLPVDYSISSSYSVSLDIESGDYIRSIFHVLMPSPLVTAKLFEEGGKGVYRFIIVVEHSKCLGMQVIVKSSVYGLLGTDNVGRDQWAGLVWGAPISLMVGLIAALVSTVIAVGLGILSGYQGFMGRLLGKLGRVFMSESLVWLYDVIINFPGLLLLMLISVVSPPDPPTVALILGLLGWGGTARVVHVIAQQTSATPFIEAERAIGATDRRIMFKHVLPHVMPY